MKQLEQELGTELFLRDRRPVTLTSAGEKIAQSAIEIMNQIEKIQTLAQDGMVGGSVRIGFVPTTLPTVLPYVLSELRARYPKLAVIVSSGLSGELAAYVAQRELDVAILTAPTSDLSGITVRNIAAEPLYAIGLDQDQSYEDDASLIQSQPFISFNSKTWLGQQIAERLRSRSLKVKQVMEVDSLEAIENLVLGGFGVSIIPQRFLAPRLSERLIRIPFCTPIEERRLVMISHERNTNTELLSTLTSVFEAAVLAEAPLGQKSAD